MSRVQTGFKKTKSERKYAPTTDELNEAIEDYLHEHPKASTDEVRSALVKAHATWNLPDRRLNKFVKRQKSGAPMTVDDDNTLSSKGPGHRIKKLFGGGVASPKNKTTKKATTTTATASTTKAPAKPAEAKPDKEAAPPKEAEPVEEAPEVAINKDVKLPAEYVDDNDGKRDNTCAACEGCMIL